MDVKLHILKNENQDWLFRVSFRNNSDSSFLLPMESIKRKGERTGLHFQSDGIDIEPIDFTLISPRTVATEIELLPNQEQIIEFSGRIELKAPDVCALSFDNTVYKLIVGKTYQVRFDWHDMQSNVLEWQAS